MARIKSYYDRKGLEAGCDEAGRGCLAGPVVAAAVILPKKVRLKGINDSKLLSENSREKLRYQIEKKALSWSVVFVHPEEIDQINILQASVAAMKRAIDNLTVRPDLLLIDGKYFTPHKNYRHNCIIKGDQKYKSIAAASILAKTHRDEYMTLLDEKYPAYLWSKNKGYPTLEHRKAILEIGPCEYHRKSFKLLPSPRQLELFTL